MTQHVEDIVQQLLARHKGEAASGADASRPGGRAARGAGRGRVDLNDIAEVIDSRPVTYEEVELIIRRLEAAGLPVGEPLTGRDVGVLRNVIVTAHRLTATLKRRPTVAELATATGMQEHAVRRALEHGAAARPFRRPPR